MKYFVANSERKSTVYHEFYRGKWDGETFWSDDSIFLHDDVLSEGFAEAIKEAVPEYYPYGETEISFVAWEKIGQIIKLKDAASQEMYREADEWLKDVFAEKDCFTILGI